MVKVLCKFGGYQDVGLGFKDPHMEPGIAEKTDLKCKMSPDELK